MPWKGGQEQNIWPDTPISNLNSANTLENHDQRPISQRSIPSSPFICIQETRQHQQQIDKSKDIYKYYFQTKRNLPGMKPCLECPICPYVKSGSSVKLTAADYTVDIMTAVNFLTKNIIYQIECDKHNCKEQYVGVSERTLQDRISDHRDMWTTITWIRLHGTILTILANKEISFYEAASIARILTRRDTFEKIHSSDPQFRKKIARQGRRV